MQSYNYPARQYPQPTRAHSATLNVPVTPNRAPPPRPRYTSLSGVPPRLPETMNPPMPQPSIPESLTPGRQGRRPIWDKSAAQPSTLYGPMGSAYHSPHRQSLYGDYFFQQSHPSLAPPPVPHKPQALVHPLPNPVPPIPPKPTALSSQPRNPLYPTSIPVPIAGPSSQLVAPEAQSPVDEKDIALAMALSASEAQARQREEELFAQEEEELLRALEESRLLSSSMHPFDDPSSPQPSSSSSLRPPSIDRASTSAIKGSAHPPEGESWLHLITPTASITSQSSSLDEDLPSLYPVEDDDESSNEPIEPFRPTPSDIREARDTGSLTPPLYANAVSNLIRKPTSVSSTSHSTNGPSSSSTISPAYSPTEYTPPPDRDPSPQFHSPLAQSNGSDASSMPPFVSRSSWTSTTSDGSAPAGRSPGGEHFSPVPGSKSPPRTPASPNLSFTSLDPLEEDTEGEEGDGSGRAVSPPSANQYVEPEMLIGVSLGFSRPVISTELAPMPGVMPNVITLPYGKAPCFHFQAPSWRKLLKLMARLSATRVEPTLEALTVAKHQLKLRTVIQFVKIHHSASEWRTLLYLTTEFPIPPTTQNSHRYTNGDVSVLPYSYTLSALPTLLRDGAESPMAKYYVVPPTATTPYPTLPINFPNLAMYLQSAVQDSRRASSDSSSGVRKLANYIDNCYQNEAESATPIDQAVSVRRGVGGMFRRVIGRHRGSSRNSSGNEEIYDLVTPFVPDEWG
ncbi:hypothetical protein BDN67DRAFT_965360 [Paxillus ammoniavirescens]|nr:hypothetical protein BDN67DRAFT_965360 [Paxillus ammoniavirescens]